MPRDFFPRETRAMKREYEIKCPKCGAPGRVELYETLNAAEEPELRDELMANRLNAVECHGCHFTFRVDKPLLYHDPKRGYMIYWAPDGERDPEIATETFRRLAEELPDAVDLAAGTAPAPTRADSAEVWMPWSMVVCTAAPGTGAFSNSTRPVLEVTVSPGVPPRVVSYCCCSPLTPARSPAAYRPPPLATSSAVTSP